MIRVPITTQAAWENLYDATVIKYECLKGCENIRVHVQLKFENEIDQDKKTVICLSTLINNSFISEIIKANEISAYIDPRSVMIIPFSETTKVWHKNIVEAFCFGNGPTTAEYPNYIKFVNQSFSINIDRPYYTTTDYKDNSIFFYQRKVNLVIPETSIILFIKDTNQVELSNMELS